MEVERDAGWPLDARPYAPAPTRPHGRLVDDWTDSIDHAIAADDWRP